MAKHNLSNVGVAEKSKDRVEKESKAKEMQVKVGLSEILGALLALVVSWMLTTITCQLKLDDVLTYASSVVGLALAVLAALGIGKILQLKESAIVMAILVAIGCVIGTVLAYCTYNFGHIEIGPHDPTPSLSTQDVTEAGPTRVPVEDNQTVPPTAPVEPENKDEGNSGDTSSIGKPVEPPIVTVAPDSKNLMTKSVLADFCALVEVSSETLASAENKSFWKASIEKAVWDLTNTDVRPESDVVNRDKAHTSQTEQANKLEAEMSKNGYTIEGTLKVIKLRENAYELHRTAGLRSLLSADYTRLADLYLKEKQWEKAYFFYMEAVEYKLQFIQLLMQPDDKYYCCIYDLADLYHKIGDTEGFNTQTKKEAYYIAACLMELAAEKLSSKSYPKQPDSFYYSGMINQKLFNLNNNAKDTAEWVPYFDDACQYFNESLRYARNRNDKYNSLSTLYEWAKNRTARKRIDGLKTSAEYAALKEEIKEQRKKVGFSN